MESEKRKVKSGKRKTQRGFSLLELLVILAVMLALLIVSIPVLYRILQNYRTQTTAVLISTNLRFARSAALKQKVRYKLTFNDELDANPNTYLVEYAPFGPTFQPFQKVDTDVPDGIKIDPTSLNEVVFDSRGAASTAGFVLLTGGDGTRYKISVSATGAVNMTKS